MEQTLIKPKKFPQKLSNIEINPRWADFIPLYLETGNAYQSALDSGFSEEYARVITSRIPEKVIKSLKEALQTKGVTPEKIANKINSLLEAKDKEGNDDFNIIDKGLKHATNIYGIEDINDKPRNQNTYNFIFNTETQKDIRALEDKIKAKLTQSNVSTT